MSAAVLGRGLYPVALLLANAGLGAWLYSLGAIAAAVALWIAGAFVVSGILAALGRTSGWLGRGTL